MNQLGQKVEQKFQHSVSTFTGWLRYFAAAVSVCGGSVQAQEQVLLNYWSILPQEEAATNTPHVIRVIGEKGAEYEEESLNPADIRNHAAIKEACIARLQTVRRETLRLSKEFENAGMTPAVAWEKALQKTCKALTGNVIGGGKRACVERLIARMEAEGSRFELSAEEMQWLLAALLEHNDCLEGDDSSRLLMHLAQQLRAEGYGKQGASAAFQDALMQNFADSLRYSQDSISAYREALFKLNRGNIVNHPLVGYLAPWGMGVHSRNQYRQAPKQYSTTLGSADSSAVASPVVIPLAAVTTTQPVTQTPAPELTPDFTAGMDKDAGRVENFLASAPAVPTPLDEGEEEKKKEEEEELENEEEYEGMAAAAPMMMRGFSLRSYAAMPVAADSAPEELTWSGSSTQTWQVNNTAAVSPWVNSAIFTNGSNVTFDDTSSSRNVNISGTVAPGKITVNTNTASGTSYSLKYGYAFDSALDGCIVDLLDSNGNVVQQTSLHNKGTALLVLNSVNRFSGGLTLDAGASVYLGCANAAGSGKITMADGSRLIVNYSSADPNYRSPSLDNAISVSGSVDVSYGTESYDDGGKIPSEWRNLTLSGGISGSGTLNLWGYSYASYPSSWFWENEVEYNYVAAFSINESQKSSSSDRFSGTVYLKNEFNHRDKNYKELTAQPEKLLGGAVQLTLTDNVFAKACINLTRGTGGRNVGEERTFNYLVGKYDLSDAGKAQTSDNILVLSDSGRIAIRALEADFLGWAWKYQNNNFWVASDIGTDLLSSLPQEDERWRSRVVTDGSTTLVLNDNTGTTHVFSGSMGFAHSYTNASQASIKLNNWQDSTECSQGKETLSLEKSGSSAQYIHSAKLNTLSLQGGTLGFNNLELSGYLNITSGTTLELGVTGTIGWDKISATNSEVTIQSGKELLVMAADDDTDSDPATYDYKFITVEGSITMSSGSDIMFNVLRPELGTTAATALMQIKGTLTLGADVPINVSFSSVDFVKDAANKTYYLASAKSGIEVNGSFAKRLIPLGHGYYGILSTENSSTTEDYLVMNVSGDPRRTWSGHADSTGKWQAADPNSTVIDYTWKEKSPFMNGQVVLFGNLYQPDGWDNPDWEPSSTGTTVVDRSKLNTGGSTSLTIDGLTLDFQSVEIEGKVAPAAIAINADYSDKNSTNFRDNTNYYFHGDGCIRDVDVKNGETVLGMDDYSGGEWHTYLRKEGTGTTVINTANTFSGGSTIEGGRMVMQNKAALGTGKITIQNSAILQGDFADDRSSGNWSSAYKGEGMDTTTITNPVYVAIYVTEDGTISSTEVDARLVGAHDKKLVLESLSGGAETVLTLSGNSLSTTEEDGEYTYSEDGKYTYSVFKVLDPGAFYGTVKMDGNLRATSEGTDGGKVQMEIMTTAKASDGGNWTNAKVDLSVENGTERTVLALDAMGTADAASSQTALIAALNGIGAGGSRINSSVVNMSQDREIMLQIQGVVRGDYDGTLGYGEFQKTVDYINSLAGDIGSTIVHHGRYNDQLKFGVLSVSKSGSATQWLNSAVLNALNVQGGAMVVDESLLVRTLTTAGATHLVVGDVSTTYAHSLVVGAGGVLAIDGMSGTDAFSGIGAGVPKYTIIVSDGDDNKATEIASSAFVLFDSGATISAGSDWKTNLIRTESVNGEDVEIDVSVDIATGATVTVNTHNYTPDESIDGNNDVFRDYHSSHAIQLLGKMTGSNVNLIFNNELISAAAVKDGSATKRADGLGYDGATGTQMGYVAIRDIHQFTGDITVEGMTALQVQNTNGSANSGSADMDITVQGANAALQFLDGVTDQYINNLVLENGGMLLLGGTLKKTTGGITAVDENQAELKIQNREGKQASLDNLDLVKTISSKTLSLGGTSTDRTEVKNALISTLDTAENYDTMKLQNVNLQNSVVSLHKACSLDLKTAVLVDKNSKVKGSISTAELQPAALAAVQSLDKLTTTLTSATETVTVGSNTTVELTTSGGTVCTASDGTKILHVYADQFQDVNVTGTGLTLILADDLWAQAYSMGMEFVAIQVGGTTGCFLFEKDNDFGNGAIGDKSGFTLTDSHGRNLNEDWVTSTFVTGNVVTGNVGSRMSGNLLWIRTPEPTTTTLSLLALTALAARRRRK